MKATDPETGISVGLIRAWNEDLDKSVRHIDYPIPSYLLELARQYGAVEVGDTMKKPKGKGGKGRGC